MYGCQSMTGKIRKVLIKRPEAAFISQEHLDGNWRRFNFANAPRYDEVLREYAVFERILDNHVDLIWVLPESGDTGLDSIYTHDAVKITRRGAVYFNTGKVLRQNEAFATRKFLEAAGVKTLGWIEAPGLMEGGDVVWLADRVVAIGLGYRTNAEGIAQFKAITEGLIDEYIVVPLPHGEGQGACLHLMSLISLIHDRLAVVYSRYLPVFFRERLRARGIDLLEVDDCEYHNLGANVLALDPENCLIMAGNPKITKALRNKGCRVHTYPGRNLSYYGTGGPTCLTCPVWRE